MGRVEELGGAGLTDGRPPPGTRTGPPAIRLADAAGLFVPSLDELCHAAVKPPPAVFAVEHVVIPADDLHRPSRFTLEDEDEITDGVGLFVVPPVDARVDNQVTLRP